MFHYIFTHRVLIKNRTTNFNTGWPRSYRKYILQITKTSLNRYEKLQYRFAVNSGSPSSIVITSTCVDFQVNSMSNLPRAGSIYFQDTFFQFFIDTVVSQTWQETFLEVSSVYRITTLTRTNCPYAATFLDIYPISPPIYIYIYINTYIHIYLHVLLFNFLTTFSFRMLCLKKPYNMDFLK